MRLRAAPALLAVAFALTLTGCGESAVCWDTTFVYDGTPDRADQQVYATLDCGGAIGTVVIQSSVSGMDHLRSGCLQSDYSHPGRSYVCTAVAWLDRDGDEYDSCMWGWDVDTCFPDPDDPQSEPQLVRLIDGGDPAWVPFTLVDP